MSADTLVNYELVAEVLQSIRNHPQHHDQSSWVGVKGSSLDQVEKFTIRHKTIEGVDFLLAEGSCETSACIAGWTLLHQGFRAEKPWNGHSSKPEAFYQRFVSSDGESSATTFDIGPEAALQLGIHEEDYDQVFMDMDNKRAVAQLMFLYEKGRLPSLLVYDGDDQLVEEFDSCDDMDFYDRYVFEDQESDDFRDQWYDRFLEAFPYQPEKEPFSE